MNDYSYKIIEVDMNEILPNRFQPRIQFDEEEILELSDSIKEHGMIQPIVVRTVGDKYEIIAGERRYKASALAGKETVPVIVKNLNDRDSAEIALIENIQRKNLTPIEEALSYKKILDMGYMTQEDLAGKLGKSQSSVANKIRLLNLSDAVQDALLENKISERHARSLLRLHSNQQQENLLERIIKERLTVRKTDEEIEKIKSNPKQEAIKREEEGEEVMNNNQNPMISEFDMFGNKKIEESSSTNQGNAEMANFNIFGTNEQTPQPVTPTLQATTPAMGGMQFENGAVTAEPEQTPQTVAPTLQATTPAMGGMQFENGVVTVEPEQTPQPVTPTLQATTPAMGGMQFENGAVTAEPEQTPQPEGFVPETSPIIDDSNVEEPTSYSFGPSTEQESNTAQNSGVNAKPEPIIITDYNKQYDPVMPIMQEEIQPTVEFKEVINIIRECSNKIEQYGFKIDLEEYDLANLYQVVFKIEK